jgi:hypothetical protein
MFPELIGNIPEEGQPSRHTTNKQLNKNKGFFRDPALEPVAGPGSVLRFTHPARGCLI